MKLLRHDTVEKELVKLEKVPAYTQVLLASQVPIDHPGHALLQASMFHPTRIEWKAPHSFKFMEDCSNMPSCFDSLNGQQVCRLYEFLNNNGKYKIIPTNQDGDCLFGAFRRCTTLPAEVADIHVRRLLVKAMAAHHEFFYLLFKVSIAVTYGIDRHSAEELQQRIQEGTISAQDLREQQMPGPFSFAGYCRYMLQESTYGDSMTLMLISMLWNLRVTCLVAENLFEYRFRHNELIAKADMVFVFNQSSEHYVAAGKRLYYIRKRLYYIGKRHW